LLKGFSSKGFHPMRKKCKCGKVAVWQYMPASTSDKEIFRCDDCVPRGCSCNFDNELDENGKELPCCEWEFSKRGWFY
jgi:hypothetical protein